MMSGRQLGWGLFLAGLPFAHLLFRPHLDPWHGQTVWFQAGVVGLTALTWMGTVRAMPKNVPLGWWVAWTGASFLLTWVHTIITRKLYPLPMALGLLHALSALLFYQAAVTTWDGMTLQRLMRWVARATVVIALYGGLQLLHLDEFFKNLDLSIAEQDQLVGTLGNPSHFGAHLAFALPLVWLQEGKRWKVALVGMSLLLLLTQSASALAAAGLGLGYCLWQTRHRWGLLGVGVLAVTSFVLWHDTLNPHGRWQAWTAFYDLFRQQPITGHGIGFVMEHSRFLTPESPLFTWRHVHNEWFQLAIEQGVIGLSLIGWMAWTWWYTARRLVQDRLTIALTAVGLAFAVNACLNFPMHLAVLASFGLLAYSGVYTLAGTQET